jgi:phosphonoacetaldehyde hydrolase
MCLDNAKHLGVYPLESMVKVDDTVPGIEEGINAGMWTVGLAKSGNEIGLTEAEIEALPADEFDRRLARAYQRMQRAGADYVIDGIWDLLECLDDIETRLRRGERPQQA